METGLKFFSSNKIAKKDYDFADFIEILPVPDNPLGVFEKIKARYRIHCPHDQFGFNPSDIKNTDKNKKILQLSVDAADSLNADLIVVHAGFNTRKLNISNPKQKAMDLLKEHFDSRMCIENVLPVDGEMIWVGYSHEDIAEFKDSGFKFCLDFGHAIDTATRLKKDKKGFIEEFLKLKPDYFHLSGTQNGFDRHLSILDSDMNLEYIKGLIKKAGKPVCLETPLDTEKRKKEIRFLKS